MEKISAEQAAKIPRKPVGRTSKARPMMMNMEKGEFLFIARQEWKWKSKVPSQICRDLEKDSTMKFKCEKALDESGWVVERLA